MITTWYVESLSIATYAQRLTNLRSLLNSHGYKNYRCRILNEKYCGNHSVFTIDLVERPRRKEFKKVERRYKKKSFLKNYL